MTVDDLGLKSGGYMHRSCRFAFAFACATNLSLSPTLSQETAPGSRLNNPTAVVRERPSVVPPQLHARQVMDQFARCLVIERKRAIEQLLNTPAIGRDSNSWSKGINLDTCLTSASAETVKLRFQKSLLRGAVYKALYVHDFSGKAPAFSPTDGSAPARMPDWSADLATAQDVDAAAKQNYVALLAFAACIVQAAPIPVHTMLLAKAGSDDENDAMAELAPAISGCLPNGETLRFSKQVFVGSVAEAAYRLAQVNKH